MTSLGEKVTVLEDFAQIYSRNIKLLQDQQRKHNAELASFAGVVTSQKKDILKMAMANSNWTQEYGSVLKGFKLLLRREIASDLEGSKEAPISEAKAELLFQIVSDKAVRLLPQTKNAQLLIESSVDAVETLEIMTENSLRTFIERHFKPAASFRIGHKASSDLDS